MQETKKCTICGKEFIPKRKNTICCSDDCRAELKRKRNKEYIRYMRPKKPQEKKNNGLDEKIKEIAKYNKKHKTNLTYGQYQAMQYIKDQHKSFCK